MLMITISVDFCNPISQKIYDDVINSLQFHRLSCPCGHSGCLSIHGYYDRTVKSGESDLRLHVCRVICSVCRHTHALLLSSIVPYSQISLPDQVDIIEHAASDGDFSSIMGPLPPSMRALSVLLSGVSAPIGNSAFYRKISYSLPAWALSDAVSLPFTDSSCRLNAPRIACF